MLRRMLAQVGQTLIFAVTIMLATLLLSTLVEEKSNKMIEVLAAAVPLDAVFLGKLLAMLGISLVGLSLWGGMRRLAYAFAGVIADWVTLPEVSPAVGWPVWIVLLLLYYAANFMLLGALFLGIGGQASNIREIQTISMPVMLLQLMVLLLAMNAVGGENATLAWIAYLVPFSSPLAMVGLRRATRKPLAASARSGLAGVVDRPDHPRLGAAVPADRAQILARRLLLRALAQAAGHGLGRRRALLLPELDLHAVAIEDPGEIAVILVLPAEDLDPLASRSAIIPSRSSTRRLIMKPASTAPYSRFPA